MRFDPTRYSMVSLLISVAPRLSNEEYIAESLRAKVVGKTNGMSALTLEK